MGDRGRPKMLLALFDVDGTLTDTTSVDTECYLPALAEVCGFARVDSDWSRYECATDAGIFHEIFEARIGRAPRADEVASFRDYFVELLRAAARRSAFGAIPGASELLARLARCDDILVALATGCWSDAARVKMTSAGMNYDEYPSASADDALEREIIIKLAVEKARKRVDGDFERTVYVGDGIWDGRACRNLRIPFIGVGSGAHSQKLSTEGAFHVCADLTDAEGFLRILRERVR